MVLALRWCLRLGFIATALATVSFLSAQEPAPNSLPALQDSVAKRTAEWNTLATNLELRIARLLPCDPRVRTAIDEVSRASDARSIALTSYWTMASVQSKAQIEAVRRLVAQEEARASDWSAEESEAKVDVALTAAQAASLASGVRQLPALAKPQKDIEAIAQLYRSLEKQAQDRATGGGPLLDDLRELLTASQARQTAIDQRVTAVSTEGLRWSAYYTARQTRARIECSITNPAAAAGREAPAPRRLPAGKKQ